MDEERGVSYMNMPLIHPHIEELDFLQGSCWFISNDLKGTPSRSLKLIPMSNQPNKVTSRLHTIEDSLFHPYMCWNVVSTWNTRWSYRLWAWHVANLELIFSLCVGIERPLEGFYVGQWMARFVYDNSLSQFWMKRFYISVQEDFRPYPSVSNSNGLVSCCDFFGFPLLKPRYIHRFF
jgi:hypothetical protein